MKQFLFAIAVLYSLNSVAQEIAISGRVTEGDSDVPLEFATATIYEFTSGTMVSGAVCDTEGRFEIIGMAGSWHGTTTGAASTTYAHGRKNYGPVMPGSLAIPSPNCYRCPIRHCLG